MSEYPSPAELHPLSEGGICAQCRGFQKHLSAHRLQLHVRKIAEEQLVLVSDILAPELQRPNSELEERKFRNNSAKPPLLQGLDNLAGRPSEFRMLLEVVYPDTAVDKHPAVLPQRGRASPRVALIL